MLHSLFEEKNKIEVAYDRLREHEPPEGYYLAYSGGKDSDVLLQLAKEAGVKFDAHMSMTSVDPREVIQYIKQNHPEVEMHKPPINMRDLIIKKKMPPTRLKRYCCEWMKERGGKEDLF